MKGPATRIRVQYRDEVIEHPYAADTVVEVIIKLIQAFGTERVLQADRTYISQYSQRLVATSPNDFSPRTYSRYGNVYISRDLGNDHKKQILEEIAADLGTSISVEVIDR